MKSLPKSLSSYLVANSVINENDDEIVSYGIDLFLSSMAELVSIILISVFIGNLKETISFFLFFIPLRIYAGGYHANTKLRCYIVSLVVYGAFTLSLHLIPTEYYINIIISEILFTLTIIYLFAPVVHNNKSVNSAEKNIYRKFSIVISLVETVIIIIGMFLEKYRIYALCFSMGQLAESFSVVISVIKNSYVKNKNPF